MKARILLLALALVACGKQGKLTPVPPQPAPVQAMGTTTPTTPEDMLKLPPQSQPNRVDDPVEKSKERPDDRFNLPPSGTR
ncbi:MAG: hypothetical protein ACOYLS_05175 [Polymorphobacter sp.]